jgi:hypothetical protein
MYDRVQRPLVTPQERDYFGRSRMFAHAFDDRQFARVMTNMLERKGCRFQDRARINRARSMPAKMREPLFTDTIQSSKAPPNLLRIIAGESGYLPGLGAEPAQGILRKSGIRERHPKAYPGKAITQEANPRSVNVKRE